MTQRSKRELKRELEHIRSEATPGTPPLDELVLRSAKRYAGEVKDPVPEDEFQELWDQAVEQDLTGES